MSESDVNWVERRAACTLQAVFDELKRGVAADVEIREKQLRDSHREYGLKFYDRHDRFTVAVLSNIYNSLAVGFVLREDSIAVVNAAGDLVFEVTVGLNPDGECRTIVNREQLQLWQVRRMALEQVFFLA